MKVSFASLLFILTLSPQIFAGIEIPICKDKNKVLAYNEEQVLSWRENLDKKFKGRAFVRGLLVGVIEDRQNHLHFEVDLDQNLESKKDRIEVVYNTEFGALSDYRSGDEVILCGDYLNDPYSPLTAVIHWLHINPNSNNHEHGFLILNGVLAGQENSKASSR